MYVYINIIDCYIIQNKKIPPTCFIERWIITKLVLVFKKLIIYFFFKYEFYENVFRNDFIKTCIYVFT